MNKFNFIFVYSIVIAILPIHAQNIDTLRLQIERIVKNKNAKVGVAVLSSRGDTLAINGDKHFPMQSVFKFHIGLAMLAQIDKQKFSLKQKIRLKKSQLLAGLWSPIREKYPQGTKLRIAEIMEYTISQSDNAGCDALLRLLGGASVVESYFVNNKFEDISIKINEEIMQSNWELQFQNWTTPKSANKVLAAFFYNKQRFLTQKSHDFIWKVMRETSTGKNRLKGLLPPETVVAHKTGWSGVHKTTGISAAVNDIGVVFLPNDQHFFISVFVTDSKEDTQTNERIIAEIAKATWDFFMKK